MTALDDLKQLTGQWAGRSSLWLQPDTPAFESPTTATVGTVAGGKIVTLDYTWTHEGAAHDGRLLVAVTADGVHMAWCDSFHMDAAILDLVGPADADLIAARGAWGPPDEPWGWRIELSPDGADQFTMRMYVILPASMGATEALGVEATYTRV